MQLDIRVMDQTALERLRSSGSHLTTILKGWVVMCEGAPNIRVLLDYYRRVDSTDHHRHLRIRYVDDRLFGSERFYLLQRIKNAVLGKNVIMVEVYPGESDVVDNSNTVHLWELPSGWAVPNLKELYQYTTSSARLGTGSSYLSTTAALMKQQPRALQSSLGTPCLDKVRTVVDELCQSLPARPSVGRKEEVERVLDTIERRKEVEIPLNTDESPGELEEQLSSHLEGTSTVEPKNSIDLNSDVSTEVLPDSSTLFDGHSMLTNDGAGVEIPHIKPTPLSEEEIGWVREPTEEHQGANVRPAACLGFVSRGQVEAWNKQA